MHTEHMPSERVGPAGKVLAANIVRLRKARGWTYTELSARTEEVGQAIAVLGLRRIERAERRVDYDDLLTLCVALDVRPVNLMVPAQTNVVPYPIGNSEFGSDTVYEWICNRGNLDPDDPFAQVIPYPRLAELEDLLGWLPEDRRQAVLRDWVREQYPEEEETDQ